MFSGDIKETSGMKWVNYTHMQNCALLNSVQGFIEIEVRLLLTFSRCLHNQLISIHSIVTY